MRRRHQGGEGEAHSHSKRRVRGYDKGRGGGWRSQCDASGAATVTLGARIDIGGEVRHPSAYADNGWPRPISGAERGASGGAYSAPPDTSPTSPPISDDAPPAFVVPHPTVVGQWFAMRHMLDPPPTSVALRTRPRPASLYGPAPDRLRPVPVQLAAAGPGPAGCGRSRSSRAVAGPWACYHQNGFTASALGTARRPSTGRPAGWAWPPSRCSNRSRRNRLMS